MYLVIIYTAGGSTSVKFKTEVEALAYIQQLADDGIECSALCCDD